jgi:TPR repeat protein
LKAHNLGNTDATNNLAYYYLNGRFSPVNKVLGKALFKIAHLLKDRRAQDHML